MLRNGPALGDQMRISPPDLQCLSRMLLFVIPCQPMHARDISSLSFKCTRSWRSLNFVLTFCITMIATPLHGKSTSARLKSQHSTSQQPQITISKCSPWCRRTPRFWIQKCLLPACSSCPDCIRECAHDVVMFPVNIWPADTCNYVLLYVQGQLLG